MGFHQSPLREAVLEFKFQHKKILGGSFGELLAARLAPMLWKIDLIVPVPMAPNRGRERGFNPANVIARQLALLLDRPCADLLSVSRPLDHQVGLRENERRRNVRGAFRLRPRVHFEGNSILLIDDVTTTGATLGECARTLQEGKPSGIYAATLTLDAKETRKAR